MEIIRRNDLHRGGFAGLTETRMVMDQRVFRGRAEPGVWDGIGNFVYLADATFQPRGETRLHNHREIDVISVIVNGRISHEGSLQHGQEMHAGHVQAQRAGGEGFSHNEINPDDVENRMIQLWVLPERAGDAANYKLYEPQEGEFKRVYGGPVDQDETLDSRTLIDVGVLAVEQSISVQGPYIVYMTVGEGVVDGKIIREGDMLRGEDLEITATTAVQLIAVHLEKGSSR